MNDRYLKSRNDFKNKDECLKQQLFSEGDNFVDINKLEQGASCGKTSSEGPTECSGELWTASVLTDESAPRKSGMNVTAY